jgi:hypothetical protein
MKIYGWFGLLLLLVSEYCLIRKIEPFVTWFYCFAWWSYILLADNLLLKLRGRSLLTSRRREFWGMLPLSIFIWLLFEAYNLFLHNWSYNIASLQMWQRWLAYVFSFATVLPGIFITSDLVELLFGRSNQPAASEYEACLPGQGSSSSHVFIALGLVLSIAPLIWPRYFFPAVWVGPVLLLDPFMEKAGIRSLSSSIFARDRRRFWSLMMGGLICGLMWEFWNYWAGSKWSYSIPFFGRWKVFEMPALGFLGFLPFALECWMLYHLLRAIPRHMNSKAARIAWWVCLVIMSLVILRNMDRLTVIKLAETTAKQFSQRSADPCVYTLF